MRLPGSHPGGDEATDESHRKAGGKDSNDQKEAKL
jgi:hypothetical protein